MFVYLFGNIQLRWFKIGFTRRTVAERLEEVQAGVPFGLHLLGHWKSQFHAETIEKITHEKFWGNHLRGEWFRDLDVEEVAKFINEKARTFNA
jgi:hypothetical protein